MVVGFIVELSAFFGGLPERFTQIGEDDAVFVQTRGNRFEIFVVAVGFGDRGKNVGDDIAG